MTTTQQISPFSIIKQVITRIASAALTVYIALIVYMLGAHFITTPQMAIVFNISEDSIAKFRSLEHYCDKKINYYITKYENDS